MNKQKKYLSTIEFAKRFEVETKVIRKAIAKGLFTRSIKRDSGKVLINWDIGQKEFLNTTTKTFIKDPVTGFYKEYDPDKVIKKKTTSRKRPSTKATTTTTTSEQHSRTRKSMTLGDVKRDKEYYSSLQAKLKYEIEEGSVVPFDAVNKEWCTIAISLRKSIMSIADRVCSVIAGEVKQNQTTKEWTFGAAAAHVIITQECKEALENAIPEDDSDDYFEEPTFSPVNEWDDADDNDNDDLTEEDNEEEEDIIIS